MIYYSYAMICKMIDHYSELAENAASFKQRVMAKQNLLLYKTMREALLN